MLSEKILNIQCFGYMKCLGFQVNQGLNRRINECIPALWNVSEPGRPGGYSAVFNGFTQLWDSCRAEFAGVSLVGPLGKEPCVPGDSADTACWIREFRQQIQGWFSPFHVCAHLCLVCCPQQHQWLKAVYLPSFCYLVLSRCVPDTTSLGWGSFRPSINKNHWTSLFLIAM